MKYRKTKMAAIIGALCLLCISGTSAYITDATEREYTFSVLTSKDGKLGELLEPNWDPKNATDLQPNETIKKDPYLKCEAEAEMWAFIKVEMPTVEGKVGNETEKTVHDGFTYEINDGWKLIEVEGYGKSNTAGTDSVYIYGYKDPVEKGEVTPTLFDNITVQDFSKLDNNFTDTVDVTGYMIQTLSIDSLEDAANIIFVSMKNENKGE